VDSDRRSILASWREKAALIFFQRREERNDMMTVGVIPVLDVAFPVLFH
jgi:hypothetical protein